jgi:hypothetical protein
VQVNLLQYLCERENAYTFKFNHLEYMT